MPNLSKLAQSAVVFDDAYTVYPESIKGLFATLCSRYPAMDTRPEAYAAVRTPSIADVLAGHGYRTALFHSGRFAYLGMRSLIEGRGFQVLEDAGDVGGRRDSSFGVDEESTVARALGWVDSLDAGQRFFLTYMPIAGHHPYESPAGGPWPETSEENCYLNALHYADRALGLLVDGLQKRGRLDQTLFIVFGDHGEAFEQHDGNFGHTNSVYEENVRIPYIIAMPGRLTSQVRSRTIAGTIDTPPTIIDLLGFDPPADWQGRSLLEGDARMALFFTDYANALVGARDGRWKFIHSPETDRSMLFDLVTDPAEMSNLAAREPRRVNRYRDRALRWAQAQRAMVVRSSH